MRNALTTLIASVLLAGTAWAEGDPAKGKKLVKSWECKDCHGISGNARSAPDQPVPMLAGQPASYLIKRMKEYKADLHDDLQHWSRMTKFIDGLSDQDIEDIAAHYAGQKRY